MRIIETPSTENLLQVVYVVNRISYVIQEVSIRLASYNSRVNEIDEVKKTDTNQICLDWPGSENGDLSCRAYI